MRVGYSRRAAFIEGEVARARMVCRRVGLTGAGIATAALRPRVGPNTAISILFIPHYFVSHRGVHWFSDLVSTERNNHSQTPG
jgi:hypothetical protein